MVVTPSWKKTHAESGYAYFSPTAPTEAELVSATLNSDRAGRYLDDAFARHVRTDDAIRALMRAAITGESNPTIRAIKERIADMARSQL